MVTSREPEDSDEDLPGRERVMAHARGKAREVAERTGVPEGGAVLGADTEVVLDGRALGKAADRREAGAMLRAYHGNVGAERPGAYVHDAMALAGRRGWLRMRGGHGSYRVV